MPYKKPQASHLQLFIFILLKFSSEDAPQPNDNFCSAFIKHIYRIIYFHECRIPLLNCSIDVARAAIL